MVKTRGKPFPIVIIEFKAAIRVRNGFAQLEPLYEVGRGKDTMLLERQKLIHNFNRSARVQAQLELLPGYWRA
jgi:hypothetical protein